MYDPKLQEEFENKIKDYNLHELNILLTVVKNKIYIESHNQTLQIMEENTQAYSGKTYRRVINFNSVNLDDINLNRDIAKRIVRYYKIVSGYSENEFRVECLVFDEEPIAELKERWYERRGYQGNFDWTFSKLHTESVMIKNIKKSYGFEEISNEEWEEAFDRYCKKVKELKWEKEK